MHQHVIVWYGERWECTCVAILGTDAVAEMHYNNTRDAGSMRTWSPDDGDR